LQVFRGPERTFADYNWAADPGAGPVSKFRGGDLSHIW